MRLVNTTDGDKCKNTDATCAADKSRDRSSVVIHTASLTLNRVPRDKARETYRDIDNNTRETYFCVPPECDSGVSSAQSTGTVPWCATCQGDTCHCNHDTIVI